MLVGYIRALGIIIMKKNLIDIYDSTLRDGAQGEGINFSVQDKLAIVKALDAFGVKYIEAGNPGSNPKDLQFFESAGRLKLKNAKLAAFGATRRKDIRPEDDVNLQSLLAANTPVVAIFGKSWDLHVTEIIHTTLDENLRMISDTVSYLLHKGKQVVFDAEHFFDGYKNNAGYAMKALSAAADAGADVLCLCDTNGGGDPKTIGEVVKAVAAAFPDKKIGIHCHNDCGMAVAASVAAVQSGASQAQGTFVGFGERCGNANLSTIIGVLQLKLGYQCVSDKNIALLTQTARAVADIANVTMETGAPFVGLSAFAHKAGMHADGVLKSSVSFEHVDPAAVGNERRFLVSEIAGRNAIISKIQKFFPEVTKESEGAAVILKTLKEMEMAGYQFEGAEGSFMLLVTKALGKFKPSFDLISFKVLTEEPSSGIDTYSAIATVKISVDSKTQFTSSEGDGPVNALDKALRKALNVFYPSIGKVTLSDYKVRVLDGASATAAKVRVLITTTDGHDIWTTVGVSTDIIKASFIALCDSIEYKLMKDGKKKT